MYRLMLVEDEALVRDSMLKNTRWEALGFEVVSACADGREAIGQLNQVVPDVVITDICMPHVDGIRLAGYIRTYFPQVLVVLLTGYGEFEYARSALKLQVFDYVLKPILPKQFDTLLEQVGQELDRRRVQKEAVYDERLLHTLRETLLRWMVRGDADPEQLRTLADRTGFRLEGRAHCVMMVTQADGSALDPQEKMQQLRTLSQRIAALDRRGENAIVDHYCIVLLFGGSTPEAALERAERFAGEILQATRDIAPVRIGIGDPVCGPAGIHGSAEQALHGLGYGFCLKTPVLVDGRERAAEVQIPYKEMRRYEKAVTDGLQQAEIQAARQAVRAWSDALAHHHVHRDQALPSLKRIETSVRDYLVQRDLLREEPWQEPSELPHLEQARQALLRQIDRAASAASGDEDPVERAERYIRAHYRDYQFSQSELLEHLGVSKSYFCALFKSAKGASFTEYLTSLRIEEAKKLLRTTNLYNGEIAARIGFLDANYFSMTFKRMEGMTPRQYRKEQV